MSERDLPNRIDIQAEQARVRMQGISREAWRRPSFSRYDEEKQAHLVEGLTAIGLVVDSRCQNRWNSQRWADVWEELREESPELVGDVVSTTSEAVAEEAFKNLFQMLEVGVSTRAELREKKRLHSQSQTKVGARASHTRQTPASRPGWDAR